MKSLMAVAAMAAVALAAPAFAQDDNSIESRLARVEQQLSQPSAREIQSSVDAYLSTAKADASLVGGCGSAGYDGGFWIRGGSFLMKINLTIQTRYETFRWDDEADEPRPGGDLSGFSLPRVTLKFSGDATCDIHYYAELEFGRAVSSGTGSQDQQIETNGFNREFGSSACREAWIEYEAAPALAFRMGLVKIAGTRQLMTPPEMQQFVDISLASAWIGNEIVGFSDRNRDYGIMVHGALGCDGEWSYMVTVTNGDGPVRRNILDQNTNDNFAYSARVNWDIKGHMGYEEGALKQHDCEWVASVGAWVFAYTDVASDKPHVTNGDELMWGVDAAAGYGSWSFTGAYSYNHEGETPGFSKETGYSYLVQVGYLFADTAWEIALRYDAYQDEPGDNGFDAGKFGAHEVAGVVNYYIDGHSDKVSLDASWLMKDNDGNDFQAVYPGYNSHFSGDAWLVRLQWQLAL